jgi:hypothetical protein
VIFQRNWAIGNCGLVIEIENCNIYRLFMQSYDELHAIWGRLLSRREYIRAVDCRRQLLRLGNVA